MKEVVLFSGGPDSWIGWKYAGKPDAIYFPLGHRYESQEKNAITRLAALDVEFAGKIKIDNSLRGIGEKEQLDAFIPARNGHLIFGAVAAGYDKIYLIVQKGELKIGDRKKEFVVNISRTASIMAEREIVVESPFFDMDKVNMVKWYVACDFDIEKLKATWSCYKDFEKQCGNCPACWRRWIAFRLNGIEEEFLANPWESKIAEDYARRINEYEGIRKKRMLQAFEFIRKEYGKEFKI